MDAVEFLKERERMCNASYDRETMCNGCCAYDPKSDKNMCKALKGVTKKQISTMDLMVAVDIVEDWSKKHPKKTLLDDFLWKYPNAILNEDTGLPIVCPCLLGYEKEDNRVCIDMGCIKCWNRPLDEVKSNATKENDPE